MTEHLARGVIKTDMPITEPHAALVRSLWVVGERWSQPGSRIMPTLYKSARRVVTPRELPLQDACDKIKGCA
jgi:hypothetical protein